MTTSPAGDGPADSEAWAAALAAGMQAQRDFRAENGNPGWDSDWDDEVEAILEAVWPHIAAHEHAEAEFDLRTSQAGRDAAGPVAEIAVARVLHGYPHCDCADGDVHAERWQDALDKAAEMVAGRDTVIDAGFLSLPAGVQDAIAAEAGRDTKETRNA